LRGEWSLADLFSDTNSMRTTLSNQANNGFLLKRTLLVMAAV